MTANTSHRSSRIETFHATKATETEKRDDTVLDLSTGRLKVHNNARLILILDVGSILILGAIALRSLQKKEVKRRIQRVGSILILDAIALRSLQKKEVKRSIQRLKVLR